MKNGLGKTILRNPKFWLEEGTSQPSSLDEGEASHKPPSKALIPESQLRNELTLALEENQKDIGVVTMVVGKRKNKCNRDATKQPSPCKDFIFPPNKSGEISSSEDS